MARAVLWSHQNRLLWINVCRSRLSRCSRVISFILSVPNIKIIKNQGLGMRIASIREKRVLITRACTNHMHVKKDTRIGPRAAMSQ
jgi:hypothetical protein